MRTPPHAPAWWLQGLRTLFHVHPLGLFQRGEAKRVGEAAAPVNVAAAAVRFANAERRAMHVCVCENDVQVGCDPACDSAPPTF